MMYSPPFGLQIAICLATLHECLKILLAESHVTLICSWLGVMENIGIKKTEALLFRELKIYVKG